MSLENEIWSRLLDKASEFTLQANDPEKWVKDFLGLGLYKNQQEIVDAIYDLAQQYIVILGSRGGGKSFGTILGLIKLALDNPGLDIGLFGPRADQANRLINEAKAILDNSKLHNDVDWDKTTAEKIIFKNGSYMLALSAAETSLQEGWHFSVIVIDEAHRVTDASMSERIMPMIGSKKITKVIKIGIPMFKNHFYKSYQDPRYTNLVHDWLNAPILLESGYTEIEDIKYPTFVLDRMPLALKVKNFPENEELHFEGDMTEIEFNTQYGMIWMDDINSFLTAEEIESLPGRGSILSGSAAGDTYYFGLDTSAGSLMPGKYDLDFTALCIWRKTSSNIKEKVWCKEWQGGDSLLQLEEIIQIVHPYTGIFPCAFGCIDYSNVGITAVELFKRHNISAAGIQFSAMETTSRKNYKNAMAHHFKFELQAGRVNYPLYDNFANDKTFHKHYLQWTSLERHNGVGLNDKIQAPSGLHDDGVMADILAVYAADRSQSFAKKGLSGLPIPQAKPTRPILNPGHNANSNLGKRYL